MNDKSIETTSRKKIYLCFLPTLFDNMCVNCQLYLISNLSFSSLQDFWVGLD